MWKLLKFLFTGSKHEHAYVVKHKQVIDHWREGAAYPHKITHTYTLQCSCGKIKSHKVTIE